MCPLCQPFLDSLSKAFLPFQGIKLSTAHARNIDLSFISQKVASFKWEIGQKGKKEREKQKWPTQWNCLKVSNATGVERKLGAGVSKEEEGEKRKRKTGAKN